MRPSTTLATTPAEDDVWDVLRTMDADVQASLALTRAALHALATLSPALWRAADLALEEEAENAQRRAAPQRMIDIVLQARLRLEQAPEEARKAMVLERALVEAAEALRAVAA